MELDLATAQAICVTLRGVSDRLRDTLAKKLKSQIAEGGHRSLDRSGSSIQAEALQLGLLMHGMPGTPAETLLAALRRHDADARVASFLQHWTQLALVAGVCAPGSGDAVATSFVDWYRGPPPSGAGTTLSKCLRRSRAAATCLPLFLSTAALTFSLSLRLNSP